MCGCSASESDEEAFTFTAMETVVHDLVNAHRESMGLPALAEASAIGIESRAHSDNMLSGETEFGHKLACN